MLDDNISLKLAGAYLELTSMCNERCPYCYNDSGSRMSFLDKSVVEKCMDELKHIDKPAIVFSGGEPFLHPNIAELIDYSEIIGVKPTIISNTELIGDEQIFPLLSREVALQITFDSVLEKSTMKHVELEILKV